MTNPKHNIASLERVAAAATPVFHTEHAKLKHHKNDLIGVDCCEEEPFVLAQMNRHMDNWKNDLAHIASFSPDTAQALLRALREARAALERINQFPTGVKISYEPAVSPGFSFFDIQDDQRKTIASLDADFDFHTEESKP